MKEETLCIHGGDEPVNCTGSLSVPIYQTAAFAHPGVDRSTGFGYFRVQSDAGTPGKGRGPAGARA